jgi:hypothetical protein
MLPTSAPRGCFTGIRHGDAAAARTRKPVRSCRCSRSMPCSCSNSRVQGAGAPRRVTGRQFRRGTGDDLLVVEATVLQERDGREFVDHQLRVGRTGIAVLAHQIEVLVLEADRLFRVLGDPLREEDHAVQLPLSEIDRYANGRAGRFVPGNLADVAAFCQPFPTSPHLRA